MNKTIIKKLIGIGLILLISNVQAKDPLSKQATIIDSSSASEVIVQATGIYHSKKRFFKKRDTRKKGPEQARMDAKRAAVYHLIYNGNNPIVTTEKELIKTKSIHNEIFSIVGSLTKEKLQQAMLKADIDNNKLSTDRIKDEVKNIIDLSSFLANGAGSRGTPTMFVNEEFIGGYISLQQMKSLLK